MIKPFYLLKHLSFASTWAVILFYFLKKIQTVVLYKTIQATYFKYYGFLLKNLAFCGEKNDFKNDFLYNLMLLIHTLSYKFVILIDFESKKFILY